MDNPNLFEQFLFEAPGDDPPDVPDDTGTETDTGPPDMPEDTGDDDMPDIGDGEDDADDGPPDIGDEDDYGGGDDEGYGGDEGGDENEEGKDENKDLHLDDKVSAVMNMTLYQRFLSLLNTISSHQSMINTNSDVLYTINPQAFNDNQKALSKLEENIRIYLTDLFVNENYSKNLLFFNKCLNLLKLLDDTFGRNIRKGVKDIE